MAIMGPEGVHAVTRVAPIHLETRTVYVEAPAARQLGLHDGQIVQAVAALRNDQLKLVLNEHIFNLPLSPYIKEGDLVQLRAQLLPAGKWALQLLHTGNFAGPEAPAAALPTRLNTLLFQPSGFANLLALLRPGVFESLIPVQDSGDLRKRMQAQRLSMGGLQPQLLKRFILGHTKSSEAYLAADEVVPDNTKVLLRLLMAERERLEEQDGVDKHDQLHHALDELEAAQVQSTQPHLQKGDLNFALVIPFKDADPVEMQFEQKGSKPGQPRNPLVVNMHTQSRALGEVWLKTTISNSSQVDLTMWALNKEVADLAKFNASELTYELENAGLVMGSFQVYNAPRPDAKEDRPPPDHGALVDTCA
jgi:hypothetical protein